MTLPTWCTSQGVDVCVGEDAKQVHRGPRRLIGRNDSRWLELLRSFKRALLNVASFLHDYFTSGYLVTSTLRSARPSWRLKLFAWPSCKALQLNAAALRELASDRWETLGMAFYTLLSPLAWCSPAPSTLASAS
jgi:hypothetical protein